MKLGNDTGQNSGEKETNGENKRTGEKENEKVKNETLKGRISGSRMRTIKKTKTEGSSRLSHKR